MPKTNQQETLPLPSLHRTDTLEQGLMERRHEQGRGRVVRFPEMARI
jgi:hypothetical protein